MENAHQPAYMQSDFDRNGVNVFDKCKQVILQNEILRHFTQNLLNLAKRFFENLTDERLGRLFRTTDNIEINSISNNSELVFRISDEDYTIKSEIFNEFLNDLFEATKDYV